MPPGCVIIGLSLRFRKPRKVSGQPKYTVYVYVDSTNNLLSKEPAQSRNCYTVYAALVTVGRAFGMSLSTVKGGR